MAFRSVAIPWLSGGLVVLGYAAYSWRRATRQRGGRESARPPEQVSSRPEQAPPGSAREPRSEAPPASGNAHARSADLGALFLGRASVALSSFQPGPHWPDR